MIRTDEGDGLNVGVVADKVDGIMRSVNHVYNAIGGSCFAEHVDEHHARSRIAFGWLDDVRVAAYECNRKHLNKKVVKTQVKPSCDIIPHPERNHGREVEGSDSSTDTERSTEGHGVHIFGDSWHCFTKLEAGDAAAVFNNL